MHILSFQLTDMIDDEEMVKKWYENLFMSGKDEEMIKANLVYIMRGMLQNCNSF